MRKLRNAVEWLRELGEDIWWAIGEWDGVRFMLGVFLAFMVLAFAVARVFRMLAA